MAKGADVDVYDAKGVAIEIVERLTRRRAEARPFVADARPAHLHPRAAGELLVGATRVGSFGTLHPAVVERLDLDGTAQVVEVDLAALEALGRAAVHHAPIPRLPAVTRDVAFAVKEAIPAGDVQALILAIAGELCESVELFDLFRGAGIPEGQRSLAFHVVYRDPRARTDPEKARTLTDAEVDQRQALVVRAAQERLGATLRA